MNEMKLEPGWLERQLKKVSEDVGLWPEWMKREAGFAAPPVAEHPDTARLRVLWNLLNESAGKEITLARRRDGRIWISDGENTLSGEDLESAIDAARAGEKA